MSDFTHIDANGNATMVDISGKDITIRQAEAFAELLLTPAITHALQKHTVQKGDVFTVAKIAGINAAKKTSELIPLCHPLLINSIDIVFCLNVELNKLEIRSTVRIEGKTGVEMEALTAVSVAALTVYDMCKAIDKGMVINQIRLLAKSGGKSGEYKAE
ncbi:MAG: cyclic pyranopterin monophosphate synthase MoaC [Ignavibacteria bacterium]|nr:cyclic pyranopterin monophosphate synthase MoaC [Ignavibacteria bacterium]